MSINSGQYAAFAIDLAQKAGAILIKHYGAMQTLEYKLKTNFKTAVDDESDRFIRQQIRRKFPDHNIYSEEENNEERGSAFNLPGWWTHLTAPSRTPLESVIISP